MHPLASPQAPCATWSTPERTPVLRPVRADDLGAMRGFMQTLSPASRRLRFHGGVKPDSDRLLRHLTQVDGVNHLAWVAVLPCDDGDVIVGEARWVRTDDTQAEFAITVADAWQGRGLGKRLMETLLHEAAAAGLEVLTGEVLADNGRMSGLLRHQGFEPNDGAAGGVRRWALPVAQGEEALA